MIYSVELARLDSNMLNNCGLSLHAANDRKERFSVALKLDGKPVFDRLFVVDRGHKNGRTVEAVTKNGIIYVYNLKKLFKCPYKALVTVMVARPNQVKRLYESCGLVASREILSKCSEHCRLGYNQI